MNFSSASHQTASPEAYNQCIKISNNQKLPEWERKIWRKRAIILNLFISDLISYEQFTLRNDILNFEMTLNSYKNMSNIVYNNNKNNSDNLKRKVKLINNLRDKLYEKNK